MAADKETIYIDVDDEITNIIEKVKNSKHKIIALVLPKRATVLQSVVNMKLLKKAATNGKKNIVLITSETSLLPLAGVAGLHVAKSLQSKPVIPPPPHQPSDDAEEAEAIGDDEPALDKTASIGSLAASAPKDEDGTETIELDNLTVDDVVPLPKELKKKKLKHLKVPNFERFRLGFFLAGLGVLLLIVGWFMAFVVMPKAHITIRTDTTSTVSSFDFTASSAVQDLDVEGRKVPATMKELKKTDSRKVAATGEKDLGTKASGKVTLSIPCASVSGSPPTIPAGTVLSTGGLNFTTEESATLNDPAFSPCRFTKTVDVIAAANGDQYNLGSGKSFTVTGYASVSGSNGTGFGGGTSKKVKVVSQKDVNDAVTAAKAQLEQSINDELKALFDAENLFALTETRKAGEPTITPTPAIDQESEEVTVATELIYTMLGIKQDDLSQLVKKDVEGDEALRGQEVTEDGISQAIMRINTQPAAGEAFISFRTTVTAGPQIDEAAIKEAIRGKKRGEAEQYIGDQPGVEDVVVEYSPFWVYSTPKAAKKITIVIEKAGDQPAEDSNSNGSE